jgi:uncharacterized membrane protein
MATTANKVMNFMVKISQANGMSILVIGLIVFWGTHALRMVAPDWRERTMARLGLGAWRTLVSVASLAGLALIGWGFARARLVTGVLWVSPVWMRHVIALLMLIAFVLLASYFAPCNQIKAKLHYPVVLAVMLWAFAHLLVNGRTVDVALFGSFLVWAVWDWLALRRGDRARRTLYPAGTFGGTLLALLGGIIGWALVTFWLHARLIGVAPLGWTF